MKYFQFLLLTSVLALTSCMTTGFEIRSRPPFDPGKTLLVVPATFGERSIPLLPLVDAGAYRVAYQSSIQAYLSMESVQAAVATAKTVEGFKAAGYKVVTAPNPLTLSLADMLGSFEPLDSGLDWSFFVPLVQKEASTAHADYVVAEGWRAIVVNPGTLGLLGTQFHVYGRIAIFSKDGALVGLGVFHSDVGGGGTHDYEVKLSASEGAKELLIQALVSASK